MHLVTSPGGGVHSYSLPKCLPTFNLYTIQYHTWPKQQHLTLTHDPDHRYAASPIQTITDGPVEGGCSAVEGIGLAQHESGPRSPRGSRRRLQDGGGHSQADVAVFAPSDKATIFVVLPAHLLAWGRGEEGVDGPC